VAAEDFINFLTRQGRLIQQEENMARNVTVSALDPTPVTDDEKSFEQRELETEVEGLRDQNLELERSFYNVRTVMHETKLKLEALNDAVLKATEAIRALRDVPLSDLDDAVTRVADELDSAVE
jgi:hypothetical protein